MVVFGPVRFLLLYAVPRQRRSLFLAGPSLARGLHRQESTEGPGHSVKKPAKFKSFGVCLDAEALLVDVGRVAAARQAGHGRQITTVTAHRLNDEHSPLGALQKKNETQFDSSLAYFQCHIFSKL